MSDNENFLARVPLFAGMPSQAMTLMAGQMRRRKLPPDSPVVYKGDPAGALYVIVSGRVKVHQATSRGEDVILQVLGAGAPFGELSLLDGLPRSADITTVEPTELAILDGEVLKTVVEREPAVAWSLLRILAQRVREQNEKMEMLMTRDVAGRVAAQLLKLADAHGKPVPPDGKYIRIEVPMTQSDLASFVGATRERVSRALAGFRTQGAIVWDQPGGHWIIRNREALLKRAEM